MWIDVDERGQCCNVVGHLQIAFGYVFFDLFFELTEYLLVSRQSLDGVLKRMERDNHVLRVPHPDDGRARLVQLTDNGRAFWNSLQERIQIFYQQALKGLSFDDSVSLLHFINKLQSDMAAISLGNEQQDDEAQ